MSELNISELNRRREFWDYQHIIPNMEELTNSPFEPMVDACKIRNIMKPKMHILEVGVGSGLATKGFYDNGYFISALDISNIALNNVREYCEYVYMIEQLDEMPSNYFDIIIMMNAIQHIPTDMLTYELGHLMRSLKNDGVLVLEFVSTDTAEDTGYNTYWDGSDSGVYCRTPKFMENMINNMGGECELVENNKCHGLGIVTGCHTFHVKKLYKI